MLKKSIKIPSCAVNFDLYSEAIRGINMFDLQESLDERLADLKRKSKKKEFTPEVREKIKQSLKRSGILNSIGKVITRVAS